MPYRRKETKPRIRWTDSEKSSVISRAVDFKTENPDLEGLNLFRNAMLDALPDARQRKVRAIGQVVWFTVRLAAALKVQAKARDRTPSLREPEPTPEPVSEPDGLDWAEHSHEIGRFLENAERTANQQKDTTTLISRLLIEIQNLHCLHREWRLRNDDQLIGILIELRKHGEMLNRIATAGILPTAEPPKSNGTTVVLPTPEPNGKPVPIFPITTVPKAPPRKSSKMRIAVVGPDAQQFSLISQQVGLTCQLNHIDRAHLRGRLPNCDWFVLNRFVSHEWWNRFLSHAGRARVIRLATGGVETFVDTIQRLAKGETPGMNGMVGTN